MCSNMCANPVLLMGSCTEPASTWVKNENTGASGRSQTMKVSPLSSFLTVVRFSKEARSCASASAERTKQTSTMCAEVKRDFIQPPSTTSKIRRYVEAGKIVKPKVAKLMIAKLKDRGENYSPLFKAQSSQCDLGAHDLLHRLPNAAGVFRNH